MKYIHRIHSMKMFDKTVGKETFMGQTIIEKILSNLKLCGTEACPTKPKLP